MISMLFSVAYYNWDDVDVCVCRWRINCNATATPTATTAMGRNVLHVGGTCLRSGIPKLAYGAHFYAY